MREEKSSGEKLSSLLEEETRGEGIGDEEATWFNLRRLCGGGGVQHVGE